MEDNKPMIYAIPDNFIDESRILRGMFKTRNFVEGIIYAAVIGFPVLALCSGQSLETKLTIMTFCAAPPFLLGVMGINGDTVSVAVKNIYKWLRSRGIMLYNQNITMLKKPPIEAREDEADFSDKIVDIIDAVKDARKEKAKNRTFIQGDTFDFIDDNENSGNEAELLYKVEDKGKLHIIDEDEWTARDVISIDISQLTEAEQTANDDEMNSILSFDDDESSEEENAQTEQEATPDTDDDGSVEPLDLDVDIDI